MEIERRAFMKCAAAAALTLLGPAIPRAQAADGAPRYLSACRLTDGSYAVAEFDPEGMIVRTIPLPNRGHGFAVTGDRRRAVAFSRHPYTFAIAFDVGGDRAPTVFASPSDRHLYGHGVFASNDRLLLATENDYDNGRGVIGVYDVDAGFDRIGEIDSNGIGPHELVMLSDGRTAAIANGGIDTHPMTGDAKLNIPTMDPSLAFLDTENGDVIAQHRLDRSLHQLSIRHLAVDAAGSVWFGCQYEGADGDQPPLIGRAGPDLAPVMLSEPPATRASLRNYIGSVAATADGSVIAASSPRGGQIIFIDVAGNVLGAEALVDGCGIAAVGDRRLVATSGEGVIATVGPDAPGDQLADADLSFDNHISGVRSA
jgi:hypothetical protein